MSAKKVEKKKPKAPKKPTKEQKEKLIQGKIDELMEARNKHALACVGWEQAHAEAGAKKKHMESLQAQMNQVVEDIDRIRKGNYTLPLPFGDEKKTQQPSAVVVGDDPRMAIELRTLFDGGVLKSLTEAKLLTVGDLAAWSRSQQLADIPGIGPGKAEKIEDRMIQFWADNPEPASGQGNASADQPTEAVAG